MLSQIPNKRLKRLLAKPLPHPIKARTQVIHQLLLRTRFPDFVGKRSGLLDAGIAGLEPEQVGVGSVFDGAFGGCRETGAVVVVAFARAGDGPGEGDGGGGKGRCEVPAGGEGEVGVGADGAGVGRDFGLFDTLGL